MVNNIGFSSQMNRVVYQKQDLVALAKYATGVPLKPQAEELTVSSVATYPLLLSGKDGFDWLRANKGQYKAAFKNVTNEAKSSYELLKKAGCGAVLGVADAKTVLTAIPKAEELAKLSATTQGLYANAQKLATAAINNPTNKEAAKSASKIFNQATAAAYAESAKTATGFFAKAKNVLGITALNKGVNNLAAKSPTFSKCVDAYNNECGTFMLAIEGGVETFSNVVPTFKQLGFKRGMKQLGKSALKVVSSVAGWVGGAAIGTKVGKIASAALGGTKVGAVVGTVIDKASSYVFGTIGQHFATKGIQKVTGQTEIEKSKVEQAELIAEAAQNDPAVFEALVEQAAQRLAVEGDDSPEAIAINPTLQNLVNAKSSCSGKESWMSPEEMSAYAKTLESKPSNNNGYTGYIPSSEPVKVQEQPQATNPIEAKQPEVITEKVREALRKSQNVLVNAKGYIK